MGILSGNPKDEPLHYGEIFGIWSYLMNAKASLGTNQTLINHTGDKDLKALISDINQSLEKPHIQQTEELLKVNGIALPPGWLERPHANIDSIPEGARFHDPEIAAMTAKNLSMGLIACSTIMGQSIREDVGAMFTKFHTEIAGFALRTLRMNKDKGWLIPPPLELKTPELAKV